MKLTKCGRTLKTQLPTVFAIALATFVSQCSSIESYGQTQPVYGNHVSLNNGSILSPRVYLPNDRVNIEPLLKNSILLGHQNPDTQIQLALMLPMRNAGELENLIKRIYNPSDPLYHKYLTCDEFTARFGPTTQDYNKVVDFALSHGFVIKQTSKSHGMLLVQGSTANVESTFQTRLNRYLVSDGRTIYTNESRPSLPASIASVISGVVGLNNAIKPHHHHNVVDALTKMMRPVYAQSRAGIGTGPNKGLAPDDIKKAYGYTQAYTGSGQTIGIIEFDTYEPSDITAYVNQFGLPTPNLTNVYVGINPPYTAGADQLEVVLDIDLVLAMAPDVNVKVYTVQNSTSGSIAVLQQIVDNNTVSVVSNSWGMPETLLPADVRTQTHNLFMQMQAQGISFFTSSGDSGSYDNGASLSVDEPASDPYVTAVGGTTLSVNTDGSYLGEVVWHGTLASGTNGGGGGGGTSVIWAKPSYQINSDSSTIGESTTKRDLPDVALNANPATGYDVYNAATNGWVTVGGTSASAPLWAGFAILVNQALAANGKSPVGFANPTLYQLGTSSQSQYFNDITSGNNDPTNLHPTLYAAKAGFDDATGWGSFKGDSLLTVLATGGATTHEGTVTGTVIDSLTGQPFPDNTLDIKLLSSKSGTVLTSTYTYNSTTGVFSIASPATSVGPYTLIVGAPDFAGKLIGNISFTTDGEIIDEGTITLLPTHTYSSPDSKKIKMVSSPYDYAGICDFYTLFAVPSPITSQSMKLYTFQPLQNSYITSPNYPCDTMRVGYGYWLKFTNTSTPLQIQGNAVSGTTFSRILQPGWNMIGLPFDMDIAVSSIQIDDGNGATSLPTSTSILLPLYYYDSALYNGTQNGGYLLKYGTDTLNPWVGYWIYAKKQVTITFSQIPLPPGPGPT